MTLKTEIARFENLGDNCEFGFVKRSLGNEEGGLLRWASTPPGALIAGLKDQFSRLYEFENLTPAWDDMVCDNAYGIGFHSSLKSRNRKWIESEKKRLKLYEVEKRKYLYLREKFLERAKNKSNILVYKVNGILCDDELFAIATAIKAIGPAQTLIVKTSEDPALIGSVQQEASYLVGYIDRFAAYDNAEMFSPVWLTIIENAARIYAA